MKQCFNVYSTDNHMLSSNFFDNSMFFLFCDHTEELNTCTFSILKLLYSQVPCIIYVNGEGNSQRSYNYAKNNTTRRVLTEMCFVIHSVTLSVVESWPPNYGMHYCIHQCRYRLTFRTYSRVTNSSEKQLLTEESKTEKSMGMENKGTTYRTLITNIRTS